MDLDGRCCRRPRVAKVAARSCRHSLEPLNRAFLKLWFTKPMVCVQVAFHENHENHKNNENDEDNAENHKQGVECWIRGNHRNHENDETHGNPGCKPRVPQTTGLEKPDLMPLFLMGCFPGGLQEGKRPIEAFGATAH